MFKKLRDWIKRPHGWGLILFYLFTAVCIGGSILFSIIGEGKSYSFVSYIFYVFAAITLGYTVYTIVIYAPKISDKVKENLKKHEFTAKILENYNYKTAVFSLISFGTTVALAVMNLVSLIRYHRLWYGAIAAYYFVLVLFRGCVLLSNRKFRKKYENDEKGYEKSQWRIYLASGAFLILLELSMGLAITEMMISGRPTESGMILAITNAAYTFYKVSMAIHNLVKARKLSNPVTQSLRNLNFADVCMSIVSLTVLMISTFDGEKPTEVMQQVKYAIGLVVCAIIIVLATFMIIKASKKLNTFKEKTINEER